jgi:hypothetical protein
MPLLDEDDVELPVTLLEDDDELASEPPVPPAPPVVPEAPSLHPLIIPSVPRQTIPKIATLRMFLLRQPFMNEAIVRAVAYPHLDANCKATDRSPFVNERQRKKNLVLDLECARFGTFFYILEPCKNQLTITVDSVVGQCTLSPTIVSIFRHNNCCLETCRNNFILLFKICFHLTICKVRRFERGRGKRLIHADEQQRWM